MSTEQIAKTVIITGGSSGLGLGVARAYIERGGNVVLYLADAQFVAGLILPVNGGVSAGGA